MEELIKVHIIFWEGQKNLPKIVSKYIISNEISSNFSGLLRLEFTILQVWTLTIFFFLVTKHYFEVWKTSNFFYYILHFKTSKFRAWNYTNNAAIFGCGIENMVNPSKELVWPNQHTQKKTIIFCEYNQFIKSCQNLTFKVNSMSRIIRILKFHNRKEISIYRIPICWILLDQERDPVFLLNLCPL